MEAIDKLIQMGYEISTDGDDNINCLYNGKGQPAEAEVTAIWGVIAANVTEAIAYIKSLIRLDILVIRQDENMDILTLNAYDMSGNPVAELNAAKTAPREEIGAFLWVEYLKNPIYNFVHSFTAGDLVIVYLNRMLMPVAANDPIAYRSPW